MTPKVFLTYVMKCFSTKTSGGNVSLKGLVFVSIHARNTTSINGVVGGVVVTFVEQLSGIKKAVLGTYIDKVGTIGIRVTGESVISLTMGRCLLRDFLRVSSPRGCGAPGKWGVRCVFWARVYKLCHRGPGVIKGAVWGSKRGPRWGYDVLSSFEQGLR